LAQYFFDTSAAAKYYHAEEGTEAVSALFDEPDRKIRISALGLLELQSSLAMKVRSGLINQDAAGIQRARLMLDIAAGDIEVYTVSPDHFAEAGRLIGKYGFAHRLRTLDSLQLAVALDLSAQGLLDYFVAADRALLQVANLEGLRVINPESH
jgi:predicted nucleic acid-binding protein